MVLLGNYYMQGFAPAGEVPSMQLRAGLLFRQKGLFKKFLSKAARSEKPEAYGKYVEGFEQGERR